MSTTTIGIDSSNSRGVTISSSSNQDLADPFDETTVTWTELTSSTPEAWVGFDVNIRNTSSIVGGLNSNVMLLIATGAASSESRIATVFPCYTYRVAGNSMYVPIPVSSGTRLSAAVCCGDSSIWYVNLVGHHASEFSTTPSYTVMDAGPFDLDAWNTSAIPSGWAPKIDPGGTANTKGSYTELSFTGGTNRSNNTIQGDSLPSAYELLGFSPVHLNNTSMSSYNFLFDVATGAASSEVDFIEDQYFNLSSNELVDMGGVRWAKGPFSSGTRISARAQASGTDATDRVFQLVMYGVR